MKQLKRHLNWKKVAIIGGVILALILLKNIPSSDNTTEEEFKKPVKKIETILYGNFSEGKSREVLATVESPADNTITARVNGTIQSLYVNIGSTVKKGQTLAQYKRSNDISQIQYENAQNTLLTTKISAENSVQNSIISLQNAKAELEQTKANEAQTRNQTFQNLNTKTTTAKTTFESAKDYADKMLGATPKYKFESSADILSIGRNNSIKKQQVLTNMQILIQEYETWQNQSVVILDKEKEAVQKAEKILGFLTRIQTTIDDISNLIRNTVTSGDFSDASKSVLQAEADGFVSKINNETLSLDSQLEAAKSQTERTNLNLLSAENRVKNAESQLKLAEANASSQISAAENQIRIAQKSATDLTITAPISGTITDVMINENDDVNIGTQLFTIVSNDTTPEIVTYVTSDELYDVRNAESITITLSNQEEIVTNQSFASSKLDPTTQKTEVRFIPTSEEIAEKNITIGSFAKIKLPFPQKTTFLPLSAISFEPDGAEVFIVNEENKIERRKITTGKIIGNTVDVSGIEDDVKIVRYRSRVNAGEIVEIENKPE